MPGKHPILNKLILLLLGLFWSTGWAMAAPSAERPIAILLSDGNEAYRVQATAFSREIDLPCQLFNLQGDIKNDPGLKERLFQAKPVLIYALGAKAAYLAKMWTRERQDIPVIFALVLNWQHYQLLEGQHNIAGIAAEMSPGTQFVNMTMFSPRVKRIGLLYGPNSKDLLDLARKEAALLGLELMAEPIEQSQDFQRGFKKIAGEVDAFWVLNDPVLYTLENLDWLEKRCLKERLLCVGQSQNLAKAGLTLSVNPDAAQIATQAAAMAGNILFNHQKISDIKVMEPLSTQLLLNLKTAKRIGLAISPQTLNLATTIIDR